MSAKGAPVFTFGLPGVEARPLPPVSYATVRKAKNMPKSDVHTKQHFLMPNHFKKGWNLV